MIDDFIQRENKGYDFAAWHDDMEFVGFDNLKQYDSVTVIMIPVLVLYGICTNL
ncbi:MAG: rhamnan synthesis F family protein [Streptococcus salivarius]